MTTSVNYKKLCIAIDKKLRLVTVGCFSMIIKGSANNHTTFSGFKRSADDAWADCYNKLTTDK